MTKTSDCYDYFYIILWRCNFNACEVKYNIRSMFMYGGVKISHPKILRLYFYLATLMKTFCN